MMGAILPANLLPKFLQLLPSLEQGKSWLSLLLFSPWTRFNANSHFEVPCCFNKRFHLNRFHSTYLIVKLQGALAFAK